MVVIPQKSQICENLVLFKNANIPKISFLGPD